MKKTVLGLLILAGSIMLSTSCKKKEEITPAKSGKYVIFTTIPYGDVAGNLTSYDQIPTGSISNSTTKSKQAKGSAGLRQVGKYMYQMSNFTEEAGVHKMSVGDDGLIKSEGFIACGTSANGAAQHIVINDDLGFYFDPDKGLLKLQKFNPTTMARTGEVDLTSQLSNSKYEFVSVGQNIQMAKEGKLFANVHYGTKDGNGFIDAQDNLVKFAVIDIATGAYEKTITYDAGNPQQVGWLGDNVMWDLSDEGDLYFLTLGKLTDGNGKVLRIKKGETEIDKTWKLEVKDYSNGGFFVDVLAKGGKIYSRIPNIAVASDFSNIGGEIWKGVVIDINSKTSTDISAPVGNFNGNGYGFQEIDGNLYLRVVKPTANINGYYLLSGNTATQAFNITEGGEAGGLIKLQ